MEICLPPSCFPGDSASDEISVINIFEKGSWCGKSEVYFAEKEAVLFIAS